MPEFDSRPPAGIDRRRFLGRSAPAAGALTLGDFLRLRAEIPRRGDRPAPSRASSSSSTAG